MTTTTTLAPSACDNPTVISASGGTFSGTTSGTDPLKPSCGATSNSGAKVFQWTPAVSGTATLSTCGPAGTTNYDTVLSLRAGACRTGSEVAAGCNDDFCACALGCATPIASKITPTVTAGQTYYAIVDGHAGSTGNFTLTVTPPTVATTTTTGAGTTTTTLASWAQRFGGTGTDIGYGVARDASGNVALAGIFHGSVSFGGVTLVSASGVSGVVAKYAASGAHIWSTSVAGPGGSTISAVTVDTNGDVVATGSFQGTVNFGDGAVTATSNNGNDIFIVKYASSDGHLLWKHAFGDIANSGFGIVCFGNGIAVDTRSNCDGAGGSNCVLLTGSFQGVVNFGGANLSDPGLTTDVFVAKFNAAGVHQWSKNFPNSASDTGRAIAADASGNVAIAGNYTGRVNFSGGSISSGLPIGNAGQACAFVAEFNSGGTHTWSRGACDTTVNAVSAVSNGVACDGSGNVVIAGTFGQTVDFGTGILTSSGNRDIFLAKYSGSGTPTWTHRYGSVTNGSGNASADAVAIDSSNNIAIVGVFYNSSLNTGVDFGGGALLSVGGGDGFVAKYSSGGGFTWANRYGASGSGSDEGRAVAFNSSGNVFVTGNFAGTADFGTQNLISNANSTDVFLIKLTSGGGL